MTITYVAVVQALSWDELEEKILNEAAQFFTVEKDALKVGEVTVVRVTENEHRSRILQAQQETVYEATAEVTKIKRSASPRAVVLG